MLLTNLKKLREDKGLTRKEVAEHLKIDQSTYGKYELGKREPDLPTITQLANFFNVSTDHLLYGFDKSTFTLLVNNVRDDRTIKEFSEDTGIDETYLKSICIGTDYKQPSVDTIVKIASEQLKDIPLELLRHYQEQGITEIEMIEKYISFRFAEKTDAETPLTPKLVAAHIPDGVELTEEEKDQLDEYIQFILSRRQK